MECREVRSLAQKLTRNSANLSLSYPNPSSQVMLLDYRLVLVPHWNKEWSQLTVLVKSTCLLTCRLPLKPQSLPVLDPRRLAGGANFPTSRRELQLKQTGRKMDSQRWNVDMLVSYRLRDRLPIGLSLEYILPAVSSQVLTAESYRVYLDGQNQRRSLLNEAFFFPSQIDSKAKGSALTLYGFQHCEGKQRLIHKQGPGLQLTKKRPPQLNKYTSRYTLISILVDIQQRNQI